MLQSRAATSPAREPAESSLHVVPDSGQQRMLRALQSHWPEYLIEAAGLGTFMVSACLFTALLEHPASAAHQMLPNAVFRRVLIGVAMGLTAVGIIYSPWGKRSGAHLNPAVTLTFLRLGKISGWDAFFYVVSQFVGGAAGVYLSAAILRSAITHPAVQYAVTIPGAAGPYIAFAGEFVISFLLMTAVLHASNSARAARFTGLFAGCLVATYIAIEAPYSGMSMNPARTIASAFPAHVWTAVWVYLTAPILAMFAAAAFYQSRGKVTVCAKLRHAPGVPCIFNCGYSAFRAGQTIFTQGDKPDFGYIIEEGTLEIRRHSDGGTEAVLARLGEGQCVGEMSLLLNQPRSATAIATCDLRLRRFTRETFAETVAADPKFAMSMLQQLAERLYEADRRLTT